MSGISDRRSTATSGDSVSEKKKKKRKIIIIRMNIIIEIILYEIYDKNFAELLRQKPPINPLDYQNDCQNRKRKKKNKKRMKKVGQKKKEKKKFR